LGVNIFSPSFQWNARVFATFETGDNHVGLSSRLDADTTVHTGENKAFTMSANESSILSGQSQICFHGDFPCNLSVSLCQFRVFVNVLFS
jgi:hypothetical protein